MVSIFNRNDTSLQRQLFVLGVALTVSTTSVRAQNADTPKTPAQAPATQYQAPQYQPAQAPQYQAPQYQAPQSQTQQYPEYKPPQQTSAQPYPKKDYYPDYSKGEYQATPDEQQKCIPDVFRLCTAFVPDAKQIVACLVAKTPELSPGCRAVVTRRIPGKKPRGKRRRAKG